MSAIKRYVIGILAAAAALFAALFGVQSGRLARRERKAAERERDLYRAANEAQMRREQRQVAAQADADEARRRAEDAIEQGKRDYFERD